MRVSERWALIRYELRRRGWMSEALFIVGGCILVTALVAYLLRPSGIGIAFAVLLAGVAFLIFASIAGLWEQRHPWSAPKTIDWGFQSDEGLADRLVGGSTHDAPTTGRTR